MPTLALPAGIISNLPASLRESQLGGSEAIVVYSEPDKAVALLTNVPPE